MSTTRDSRASYSRDGYGRTNNSNTSNGSSFGRDRNDRNKPAPTDNKNRFRKK